MTVRRTLRVPLSWIGLVCVWIPVPGYADGLLLKDGRYPGPVVTFRLTAEQKAIIDRFRTCHVAHHAVMNVYTPYIFVLSGKQAKALKARKGFCPRRFQVYETYRGDNDAGPHWNLALRVSADDIEIPLDILVPDAEAAAYHKEQGWRTPNPCFKKR